MRKMPGISRDNPEENKGNAVKENSRDRNSLHIASFGLSPTVPKVGTTPGLL